MAKTSIKEREERKVQKAERARVMRLNLKKIIRKGGLEEQEEALLKLQKRPRNESKSRIRNRCRSCGRPRGTLRRFRLCRLCLRKAAMRGDVPGLKKSSW